MMNALRIAFEVMSWLALGLSAVGVLYTKRGVAAAKEALDESREALALARSVKPTLIPAEEEIEAEIDQEVAWRGMVGERGE